MLEFESKHVPRIRPVLTKMYMARPDKAMGVSGIYGKPIQRNGEYEEEEDEQDGEHVSVSDFGGEESEQTRTEQDDELDLPFTKFNLLATICSIVFFLYDFVSYIVLAEEYFRHQRFVPFWFTSAFILFPAIVSNGQSIKWYWSDYKKEKSNRLTEKEENYDIQSQHTVHTSCCTWFCRVFFTFPLMMGPAVRLELK